MEAKLYTELDRKRESFYEKEFGYFLPWIFIHPGTLSSRDLLHLSRHMTKIGYIYYLFLLKQESNSIKLLHFGRLILNSWNFSYALQDHLFEITIHQLNSEIISFAFTLDMILYRRNIQTSLIFLALKWLLLHYWNNLP